MRDKVIGVVEKYIDAVRRNDPTDLPLHPDVIGVFPMNTYQGAGAFVRALEPFSRIVKNINVLRLVVDGEHCVAILNIDTVFGPIPFAEHIQVVDEQIVSVRGYYDPRPMLGEQTLGRRHGRLVSQADSELQRAVPVCWVRALAGDAQRPLGARSGTVRRLPR